MRSIAIKILLSSIYAILLCGVLQIVHAGKAALIGDPLVGLYVDTATAGLNHLPEDIRKGARLQPDEYWVFASYDDSARTGDRYFIISRGRKFGMFGMIVVVNNGKYRIDAAENFDNRGLPNYVVRALAQDAVVHLIRIFGSKEAVQKKITEEWKKLNGNAQVVPAMADALREAGITNVRKIGEKPKCFLWVFACN